ncbi:MAG: electron transfer flavoprotein subunit beta/FixA family protein [Chloroflexota bacterium]
MNIIVPIKLVPDLVEELSIDTSGNALDTTWMRLILSEFDDHAIEQAILLKEKEGATVTVVAPDVEGIDDVLFGASAKGADRLIKLTGDFNVGMPNHAFTSGLKDVINALQPDLVLTGVQAHNDLDGTVGGLLAEHLGMPYVGYISAVSVSGGKALVKKEYPGGLLAEMEVTLPAVLGIQAAEAPPRYVAISKVRQAMKTGSINEQAVGEMDPAGGPTIERMYLPEAAGRATMIDGEPEAVVARLIEIFKEAGVL